LKKMKAILNALLESKDLTRKQAETVMQSIIEGAVPVEQVSAFLMAMRFKQPTVDEIVGFVSVMRNHAVKVAISRKDLLDVCGTGGDGAGTFNISTTTAFVVAGAGAGVAKHGNRSVSSLCGSADVLEALGVKTGLNPQKTAQAVDHTGLGFFFAPTFHPAMKNLAQVRRNLGVRTVFNLLGPLTNPVNAPFQVLGVFDRKLLPLVAEALRELGSKEVLVVAGEDGLDELTLCGKTFVAHLKKGEIQNYEIYPEDAGLHPARAEDLLGGDSKQNAEILLGVLSGRKGPPRDAVLLNSAAALLVCGLVKDLKSGVVVAAESIDSGKAMKILSLHRNIA
jgi:anthranilate phosphoribosyltransferase